MSHERAKLFCRSISIRFSVQYINEIYYKWSKHNESRDTQIPKKTDAYKKCEYFYNLINKSKSYYL